VGEHIHQEHLEGWMAEESSCCQVGQVLAKVAQQADYLLPDPLWCLFRERNGVSVCALRGDEDKRTLLRVDREPDAIFDIALKVAEFRLSKVIIDAVVDSWGTIRRRCWDEMEKMYGSAESALSNCEQCHKKPEGQDFAEWQPVQSAQAHPCCPGNERQCSPRRTPRLGW
jgi:hypothetical protein